MATKIEQRARANIRRLKDQSALSVPELALILGMDETTLARHLGKGKISASRARQYAAIRNVGVSDGAVHLVVARPDRARKPKLGGEALEAEKRRAIGLLDQLRQG